MADRRAKLPLDPNAVATANQQLWAKYPQLKGSQLPMTPGKPWSTYRTFWMNAYLASLPQTEGPVAPHAEPVAPVAPVVTPCACKLVSITVIRNATQTNVTGPKNWATVKKSTDDVIVQAKTDPDTPECWDKINWSGDSGSTVPGHANQRSLSRATSKKYHVQADLGGSDFVDVWVLWATVKINTSDTTPPNAVQYGARYDGTENLGAQSFGGGNQAVGKVVPEATITPAGVHDVVKSGWAFRRERISHDWNDGKKAPGYWDNSWVDDTSLAEYQNLTPGADDKIYDRDAPNIANFGKTNAETYNNFRQWTEWNGETCSDKAGWYWRGRWEKAEAPQVTLKEVGEGNKALPEVSFFHH